MDSDSDAAIWNLWQQQAREEPIMPLDEIRRKAGRLNTKTRRWRVATMLIFSVLLITVAGELWGQEGVLERTGDLLSIAALLYVAYHVRKRHLTSAPVALGRTNGVEFYRAELVRQRDLSRESWRSLLPFVPGVTLSLFGSGFENRPASQIIAIVVSGVALFLGAVWLNAHTARKLQNEIDDYDSALQ